MSLLYIYDWSYETSDDSILIRVYGLNEKNETVVLTIEDFTPYMYVELPSNIAWTLQKLQVLCEAVDKKCFRDGLPVERQMVKRKRLYYAHKTKTMDDHLYQYILYKFTTNDKFRSFSYRFQKPILVPGIGNVQLKVHETNATPILQLACVQNIPMSGWIEYRKARELVGTEKETSATYEFIVSFKHLRRSNSQLQTPSPTVLSFDLEVFSSNPNRMPNASNTHDVLFQISCIFWNTHTTKKYLLSLGEPDPDIVGKETTTLCFRTEAALIIGFTKLIQEHNPHIITGWNILGFDFPYIMDRAKLTMTSSVLAKTGMIIGKHCEEVEDTWSSSAYGNQSFRYIKMDGRIIIDLLTFARRELKFPNYKLETIASHYLQAHKDPFTAKDIFAAYERGMKGDHKFLAECGHYCVQDAVLVQRLFNVFDTWTGLTEMSNVCNVPSSYLYTKGQQIKVFSQVTKYCYDNGIVVENDAYKPQGNEKYQGATVLQPTPGLYNYVVPFDFCFTGETRVSLQCGISRRIDCLQNETVLGYAGNRNLQQYKMVHGLQEKGVREIVVVTLNDGTVLRCTPEHKILTWSGKWLRADSLMGESIMGSISYTEDIVCSLEPNWSITTPLGVLDMTSAGSRDRSLAFARILGFTFQRGRNIKFQTKLDADNFYADLCLVCDEFETIRTDSICFSLPIAFCEFGAELPPFLLSDNCPMSILREFLGGYYGSMGIAPGFKSSKFTNVRLSLESPKWIYLHNRIGIETTTVTHFPQHAMIPNTELFEERIGFRYSFEKSYRLAIAASYMRMYRRIQTQRDWILERSDDTEDSFIQAQNELSEQEALLTSFYWIYPSPLDFLVESYALDWFHGDGLHLKESIPCFRRTVVDVRPGTPEPVYDIEVETTHSFVANGAVVSNCSLYPSVIIAYNIDYSTFVTDTAIPDELCHIIEWAEHVACKHTPFPNPTAEGYMCEEYRFRFLKEPKGVLPSICENMLLARKNTRKTMKELSVKMEMLCDSDEKTKLQTYIGILNKRQLAYKINVNSIYGSMGVKKGYLPFMPGAMAVTAMGRFNLRKAANHLESVHRAKLIYGDTDSCYVTFPEIQNPIDLWSHAERIEQYMVQNHVFPSPMKLEFENAIYNPFLILTKKRYMWRDFHRDGTSSEKVGNKGVILSRRDNALFSQNLYKEIVNGVFEHWTREQTMHYIVDRFNACCSLPHSDFIITKKVGVVDNYKIRALPEDEKKRAKRLLDLKCTEEEYESRALPAQMQLAERMRSRGVRVDEGQRLEYIVTTRGGPKAKLFDKIEDPEYRDEHGSVIPIDYFYYIKLISTQITEVMDVVFSETKFITEQLKLRQQRLKLHDELKSYFRPNLIVRKQVQRRIIK